MSRNPRGEIIEGLKPYLPKNGRGSICWVREGHEYLEVRMKTAPLKNIDLWGAAKKLYGEIPYRFSSQSYPSPRVLQQ